LKNNIIDNQFLSLIFFTIKKYYCLPYLKILLKFLLKFLKNNGNRIIIIKISFESKI